MTSESPVPSFNELGLSEPILEALAAVGYESPSPIQAQTIPVLLSGADVLGQAQTGTGKTAAFALPVLSMIELAQMAPQALVLVPTRELAIQVSEAFQKYAANLRGFHVLPIYGGQSYTPQLKGLRRGAHVIVGTPGRVMDHIKSGALDISTLRFVVLDEGDEMLQMGFIDDIEWILEQAPEERQIALFSATMPSAIRRVAQTHMRDPQQITIQSRAATAPNIRQRVWFVSGMHKLDALTRMLEVEKFDALLVFVRTKLETVDLAERLEARGFAAAALNGDIPQQQREKTIARLKNGQLDIVVATDVAARGLDVERISHVVNYDIPYDSETYVHRIGRTGRAGRSGEAILFVAPRERNMLRIIERATRSRIEPMTLPSVSDVNEHRVLKFKERVTAAVQNGEGKVFQELLEQMEREQNIPAIEIAAALAGLLQGDTPFLLAGRAGREDSSRAGGGAWPRSLSDADAANEPVAAAKAATSARAERESDRAVSSPRDDGPARGDIAPARADTEQHASTEDGGESSEVAASAEDREPSAQDVQPAREERRPRREASETGSGENAIPMETFRLEVGHVQGVLPGNIVGAIANEAGLDGKHIGHIDIREDHSYVDLPAGMPKEIFRELKKVKIRGAELRISRVDSKPPRPERTGFRSRREDGDREFRPRRPAGDREFAPRREGGEGFRPRSFGPRSFEDRPPRSRPPGSFAPRGAEGGEFPPRERDSAAGDQPREFRPRREGGEGFRPRSFGPRSSGPRSSGDRPPRFRESGGFAPPRREGGDFPPRDREAAGGDRPREFRPGKPHGIRAGKPEGRGFGKGPSRGPGKGPRKPFVPRER